MRPDRALPRATKVTIARRSRRGVRSVVHRVHIKCPFCSWYEFRDVDMAQIGPSRQHLDGEFTRHMRARHHQYLTGA